MVKALKNYLWHLRKAIAATFWYGFPAKSLTVIGVTGTKGKTTTCHLIAHILKTQMAKVGLISTIGAFLGDEQLDTGLHVTTPGPFELQRLLRLAIRRGITHIVLEVTSSALDQFRVWSIPFSIGVVTNIAPDHLDYHGSMDQYINAKSQLIRQSNEVVLDKRSPFFSQLKKAVRPGAKIALYESAPSSPTISNRRAAAEVAKLCGVPRTNVDKALASFSGVLGRFEAVYDDEFQVIIDFAHTPESLEAALRELRPRVKGGGRLIAVFGSAGERDPGRRRMGEIAAKYADFFVITAEDPRTERVEDISEDIAVLARKAGSKEEVGFVKIPDRQKAITRAIEMAKNGDVIGLFGKGHERSMAFGREERPWSEHDAVTEALKARRTKKK